MKIRIQSDMDFTPAGKRSVRHHVGHNVIVGYVSGHQYMRLAPTKENMAKAIEWRDNTTGLCPQPWSAFQ